MMTQNGMLVDNGFVLFLQEICIPLAIVGLILIIQAFTEAPKDITFEDIDNNIKNKK